MNHMRVLRPADGLYAFYDGRVDGYRFAEGPNWVDEGALALGIASYALLAGEEALVYDTHTTVEHARLVREKLEEEGARRFTVVLSHWHLDHVAGTEVFQDSEVISSERTAEHLTAQAGGDRERGAGRPTADRSADPADAHLLEPIEPEGRRGAGGADPRRHPQR